MNKKRPEYTADLSKDNVEARLEDFWRDNWAPRKAEQLSNEAFKTVEKYGPAVAAAVGKIAGVGTKIRGGSQLGYTQEMREF